MKTKNKMVAWFVSNCNVGSKRLEYVKELQMFIQVSLPTSECLNLEKQYKKFLPHYYCKLQYTVLRILLTSSSYQNSYFEIYFGLFVIFFEDGPLFNSVTDF